MPRTFTIQTPNGRTLDIEAETEEAALAGAKQWYDDVDAVVRTTIGEAGVDPDSQPGVAATILNRSKLTGQSPRDVVIAEGQFEPWSRPEKRREMESLDPMGEEYQGVLNRILPVLGGEDPTEGSTHFYAPKAQAALGRSPPKWDDGSGRDFGAHRFFARPGDFGGAAPEVQLTKAIAPDEAAPDSPAPEGPEPRSTKHSYTGLDLNISEAQAATAERDLRAGELDKDEPVGSRRNKFYQVSRDEAGPADKWWVDLDGQVHAPEGYRAAAFDAQKRAAENPYMKPGMKEVGLQGMTLNFADEIEGTVASFETKAKNALRKMRGEPIPYTSDDTYDAARDVFLSEEAAFRKADPKGALREELVGAVLTPGLAKGGGWVAGGKILFEKSVRSAQLGGALGAAAGAGGADNGDRVEGSVGGAAAGAATGALLPPAFDLVGRPLGAAYRAAMGSVAPRIEEMLPGLAKYLPRPQNPADVKAADALARMEQQDVLAGVPRKTGVAPYQGGGENTAALAEVVAHSPGPGRQLLQSAARESQGATYRGVKEDIAAGLGGKGDYFATHDAMVAAQREAARDGMAKFGGHAVTLDENSVLALRSDLARGAIKDSAQNMLASPDPAVRAAGAQLNRLGDDVLDNPAASSLTIQAAQDISLALRQAATSAFKNGDGGRGNALRSLSVAIRDNARDPKRGGLSAYDDWLKKYGDDAEQLEALERGRGVMTRNTDDFAAERIKLDMEDWSETAKEMFRKGVGESMLQYARVNGGAAGLRRALKEEFSDRVKLAFKDEAGFNAFMKSAEERLAAEARDARIIGGSPTYARGAAAAALEDGNQSGMQVLGSAALDVASLDVPAMLRLGKAGLKELLKNAPKGTQSALKDPAANAVLARALADEDEYTRLLNVLELQSALQLAPKLSGASGYLAGPAVAATQ